MIPSLFHLTEARELWEKDVQFLGMLYQQAPHNRNYGCLWYGDLHFILRQHITHNGCYILMIFEFFLKNYMDVYTYTHECRCSVRLEEGVGLELELQILVSHPHSAGS